MRTAVTETSLVAYHSLTVNDGLQRREREVMAVFALNPSERYTRQQLVDQAGLTLQCICGRVRTLLDKKRLVVLGEIIDPTTRRPQELLGLPVVKQMGLF